MPVNCLQAFGFYSIILLILLFDFYPILHLHLLQLLVDALHGQAHDVEVAAA